ncbi:MAG TPA: hypothetical protein VKY22_18340 [Bradyrhizobium sp.]|nr:hypothetical protein [Bradyrhizobium sp.]
MRHANTISKAPVAVSAVHIVPPDERIAAGKALRDKVPREWHGGWKEFKGRPSPIDILQSAVAADIVTSLASSGWIGCRPL